MKPVMMSVVGDDDCDGDGYSDGDGDGDCVRLFPSNCTTQVSYQESHGGIRSHLCNTTVTPLWNSSDTTVNTIATPL
jgi:hypothetical protein